MKLEHATATNPTHKLTDPKSNSSSPFDQLSTVGKTQVAQIIHDVSILSLNLGSAPVHHGLNSICK